MGWSEIRYCARDPRQNKTHGDDGFVVDAVEFGAIMTMV
jgi:hypothetical protein